jgi:hypothetical protein
MVANGSRDVPGAAMTKPECEKAIRDLCHVWANECGIPHAPKDQPSYFSFKSWAQAKGYGHYWSFRSRMGADYDAEMWFDQEFRQTWRN